MTDASYLTPKAEVQQSLIEGKGLIAREPIQKGELVVDFSRGTGRMIATAEAKALYENGFDYLMQVGDGRYFAAMTDKEVEDADFINHSCDPNLGIQGSLRLVAMRDIRKGEELNFDYAMSESMEYRMTCNCGSPRCRKVVTGEDWKLSQLQKRYDGYFSDYLRKRIDAVQTH